MAAVESGGRRLKPGRETARRRTPGSRAAGVSGLVFDDLDQVREMIARYDSDHDRELLRRDRLRYVIQTMDGARAQLGRVRSSAPMRIRGTPRAFLLHVPEDGRTTYRVGDRVFEAAPGRAVLLTPGQLFTSWSSGGTTLSLRVEEAALREESAALADSESPERLELEAILPLDTPAGRHLAGLLSLEDVEAAPGGSATLRHWETAVASALARAAGDLGKGSERPPRTADERRRVREVEEWIDAHFTRPMSLGELCRVSGLPARTLHRAFLRHRGQPPMRHVIQRRLAEARSRLLERRQGDSVMAVALESGFTHLGRFAGLYRETYGELPSESLSARRAREIGRPTQKA